MSLTLSEQTQSRKRPNLKFEQWLLNVTCSGSRTLSVHFTWTLTSIPGSVWKMRTRSASRLRTTYQSLHYEYILFPVMR